MSLRLSVFSPLATLLLFGALSACGGGDDDTADDVADDGSDDGDGVSASCLEAEDHDDLEWIQDNILTRGCALSSSCHKGDAGDANGLNLEAGTSESSLVGVQAIAEEADGMVLVTPGDPENSYLLVILGHFGEDDPRIPDDGDARMPFNSPPLCQEKLDAIERWITSL
jgi:hypothetical protein